MPFLALHPQLQLSDAFLSASRVVQVPVLCLCFNSLAALHLPLLLPSFLSSPIFPLFPHLTSSPPFTLQSFPPLLGSIFTPLRTFARLTRFWSRCVPVLALRIHQRAHLIHSSRTRDHLVIVNRNNFRELQHSAVLSSGQLRFRPPATLCCSTSFSGPAVQLFPPPIRHWPYTIGTR